MKATKKIVIKRGLEDLLRHLRYNGEITDNMFATLKKEGGDFFPMRMRRLIFYREKKTFITFPFPQEIKMFSSWRWNLLNFRIPLGNVRFHPNVVGVLSSKEDREKFEKNRKELEEYLKEDVDDPVKKELVKTEEIMVNKKGGEDVRLLFNYYTSVED